MLYTYHRLKTIYLNTFTTIYYNIKGGVMGMVFDEEDELEYEDVLKLNDEDAAEKPCN